MLRRRTHTVMWPARVQRELEREQYRSELLVTAVQLLIAAVLAVLYALTPPGFSPDAPLRAVPIGLTLFAIAALMRLYLAVTDQLQRWMVGTTVVIEMAVLMFVIWAYHLQYEQPAPFYLKCTEFAYVFILIALRTLRFEPVWVVLSGLTAAAGWLVLLAYALTHGQGNPVTWDYVTSLPSTQIHLGGEFDNLLAILLTTAVLALAPTQFRRQIGFGSAGRHGPFHVLRRPGRGPYHTVGVHGHARAGRSTRRNHCVPRYARLHGSIAQPVRHRRDRLAP